MNKYIKTQLNLVKVADLPYFDEDTVYIHIPKQTPNQVGQVKAGHYYLIELADYLLNPPKGFTLHDTWNQGKIPTQKYYKCKCVKNIGKMIQILGVGFEYESRTDLDEYWDGWLPLKSIKVLREI